MLEHPQFEAHIAPHIASLRAEIGEDDLSLHPTRCDGPFDWADSLYVSRPLTLVKILEIYTAWLRLECSDAGTGASREVWINDALFLISAAVFSSTDGARESERAAAS